MSPSSKNLALWVIIGLLLIALFNLFQSPGSRGPQTSLAFSCFLSEVQAGRVGDVTIQGNSISGHFSDGRSFNTYAPFDPGLVDLAMAASGIQEGAGAPMPRPAYRPTLDFAPLSAGIGRATQRAAFADAIDAGSDDEGDQQVDALFAELGAGVGPALVRAL